MTIIDKDGYCLDQIDVQTRSRLVKYTMLACRGLTIISLIIIIIIIIIILIIIIIMIIIFLLPDGKPNEHSAIFLGALKNIIITKYMK